MAGIHLAINRSDLVTLSRVGVLALSCALACTPEGQQPGLQSASPTLSPAPTEVAAAPASPGPSTIEGYIDPPVRDDMVGGWVNGWFADRSAPSGAGIASVTLYLDGRPGAGTLLGTAPYGDPSPDVADYFKDQRFAHARWHFDWKTAGFFPLGRHTLYVTVRSTIGTSAVFTWQLGAQPYGAIEVHPGPNGFVVGEPIQMAGWAIDAGRTFDSGVDEISVTATGPRSYTVVAGDTLWEIARRATGDAARWTEIARANELGDQYQLRVGQRLLVNWSKPWLLGHASLGFESRGVVDLMVDPLFANGGYRFVVDTADFAEGQHWLQANVHARASGAVTVLQQPVDIFATAARARIDALTPHGGLVYELGLAQPKPSDSVTVARSAAVRYSGNRFDLIGENDGAPASSRVLRFSIDPRVNARYVGVLEFAAESGSRPDFQWTLRAGGQTTYLLVFSGKTETMYLDDPRVQGGYTPQAPIPGLASGRRLTVSIVSDVALLKIYIDGEMVDYFDNRGGPTLGDGHGSPEIGISGAPGTIHIYSLRIYAWL